MRHAATPAQAAHTAPDTGADRGYKPVGAVQHAINLLRTLSEADAPMGVTAAARKAGVNPSTALAILRTLSDEQLLQFDPAAKTYAPGLGLLSLARGLLGHKHADLIRPELVRLATNFQCLIALWQVVGDRVVLIDRALADTPVRLDIQVTQRMPAYLGAIGRVVAAHTGLSQSELHNKFSVLRWANPISFDQYLAEIDEARVRGYAIDRESLYRGITVAASVILDRRSQPALGVSAIMVAGNHHADEVHAVGANLGTLCRTASGLTPD
jgi:DNA-binding IclR family transcriptional regulator